MPLPRTLCRFPLQAAAMRSLPRSGLVQASLCRVLDYAEHPALSRRFVQ
jgi:hypothetical protein